MNKLAELKKLTEAATPENQLATSIKALIELCEMQNTALVIEHNVNCNVADHIYEALAAYEQFNGEE